MKRNYGEIEEILEQVKKLLEGYGTTPQKVTATVLCVEEILHRYSGIITSDMPVYFDVRRTSRDLSVIVSIKGTECPIEQAEDEIPILDHILKKMNFRFSHKYASGLNTDCIVIEKYSHFTGDLKFAFRYMGKDRKLLFCGFATHIISILANLIVPYFSGRLIVAYTDSVWEQIIFMAVIITILRCIYIIFFKITNILYTKSTYNMMHTIRRKMVNNLFLVEDEIFDEKGAGPFTTMINTDALTIANGLSTIADIFSEFAYYAGVLIAILMVDKIAFLIALVLLIILLVLEEIRAYYLGIDKRKEYVSMDRASGLVFDLVNGTKEIKNLNAEENLSARYDSFDRENIHDKTLANTRTQILSIINHIVMYACYCLVMLYLGWNVSTHRIETALALVLFNYFTIIGIPTITLIQRTIDFKKSYNLACERVRDFLDGSEYTKNTFGNFTPQENIKGEIAFKNVSFIYNYNNPLEEDNPVLKEINLIVHPGEKVALVGMSGCGKSTTLRLVNRQRDCNAGTITLDGVNIMDYDKDTLRKSISVVSQFPYIFNATVKENLLFAKPDASVEELEDACRKACLLNDIQKMPKGFDTELKEKGIRLSGGQAQRMAIARALLRNTPVLILDEATSALDNVTQKSIIDIITKNNQTVLMVAHRLSTIKDADRIALMSEGRIVAVGTHEELMNSCKEYKLLYQAESKP